jgi:hypothetical protein
VQSRGCPSSLPPSSEKIDVKMEGREGREGNHMARYLDGREGKTHMER